MEPITEPAQARVDVFEVFKSGSHLLDDLKAQEFAELRRTYVVIQPVRTIQDLEKPDIALGKMAPDKMVVEREQFKEQVAKKIQEAVSMKRTQEVDASIEKLTHDADEMFRSEVRTMRSSLLEKVLAIVSDEAVSAGGKEEMIRKCFAAIELVKK